jgi:hypothetical protein
MTKNVFRGCYAQEKPRGRCGHFIHEGNVHRGDDMDRVYCAECDEHQTLWGEERL